MNINGGYAKIAPLFTNSSYNETINKAMNNMKFLWAVILGAVGLNAQLIESIEFKGLVHLSADVAGDIMGISNGVPLDETVLNDGIKKLYNQGYFKDIWVTHEAGNLTLFCTEKPIISKITVVGFEESDEKKRNEVLQLKKGQTYDEISVQTAKKRILEALERDGAIDSIVEVEEMFTENGSVELTFTANKGKEITITSLVLHGVKGLDSNKVTQAIANKAAQSFGWFWGRSDGALKLSELKIDPMRMQETYRQNGYLDAEVLTPLLRVDFNSYTAELSYQVEEGVQYIVESVHYNGYEEVLDDAKMATLVQLKSGDVFDIALFREDMSRIQTAIADVGYAYAKVLPDMDKDPKTGKVKITYNAQPGEKVYIRDVHITGNDRTLDRIIRRDVFLSPGDLFNATDLKDSQNMLGRTGFFETATIEQKRVSNHEMDLIVHVKETPTGNVQVGGGYGSYGGLTFDASLSDRNIFGSGLNVGVQVQSSRFTGQTSLSLSNPRINDSKYSGSTNVFARRFELINTYTSKQQGVTLSLGRLFTRTFSGSLGYRYIDARFEDVNPSANLTEQQTQPYEKSSVSLSLNYNNTDDFYVPRNGLRLSDSFEVAGLGGSAKFIKNNVSYAQYFGVRDAWNVDAIFRYKLNVRHIQNLGFIPLDEHYFMGGLGTVRGYEQFSLPTYLSGFERSFYATKMATSSFEVSFPLVASARLRWAVFVDYGYIGETEFMQEGRGGYGAQIEWFSPMGPIALVFANAIDSQPGDRVNGFEFSIGRPF